MVFVKEVKINTNPAAEASLPLLSVFRFLYLPQPAAPTVFSLAKDYYVFPSTDLGYINSFSLPDPSGSVFSLQLKLEPELFFPSLGWCEDPARCEAGGFLWRLDCVLVIHPPRCFKEAEHSSAEHKPKAYRVGWDLSHCAEVFETPAKCFSEL